MMYEDKGRKRVSELDKNDKLESALLNIAQVEFPHRDMAKIYVYWEIQDNKKVNYTFMDAKFADMDPKSIGVPANEIDLPKEVEDVNEAGLIINKKDGAYPKEGQILVMAGGGGSGKSFILENLLLFEGKVFNVDKAKEYLRLIGRKTPDSTLAQKYKKDYGYALGDVSLKNPQHCNDLHEFVSKYRLTLEPQAIFFRTAAALKQKPNVIFDMTMRDLKHLDYIGQYAKQGGYDPKNVHIVWVLNSIKVALDQNAKRERSEPMEVIVDAHKGVATTMKNLFEASESWRGICDGDIWIVFNQKGVDVKAIVNINRDDLGNKKINFTIDDYVAIHMKERGKPSKKFSDLEQPIIDKIKSYVPDSVKNKIG